MLNIHCVAKVTRLAYYYNFDRHQPILIILAEMLRKQSNDDFPTSPN